MTLDAAELETYERVIEVDLLGVVRTIKPALPEVIANRGHVLITAFDLRIRQRRDQLCLRGLKSRG